SLITMDVSRATWFFAPGVGVKVTQSRGPPSGYRASEYAPRATPAGGSRLKVVAEAQSPSGSRRKSWTLSVERSRPVPDCVTTRKPPGAIDVPAGKRYGAARSGSSVKVKP